MLRWLYDIHNQYAAEQVFIEEVKKSPDYTPVQKAVLIYNAKDVVEKISKGDWQQHFGFLTDANQ